MIDETLRQAIRQEVPVQMIYLDQKGCITQRWVRVQSISRADILVYCLHKRAYRRFKRERVLAAALEDWSFSRCGMTGSTGMIGVD
ncbi:hypothetical protein [Desmospora activa]|uniref:WYL domain-containing protein n=1 Tax=Desmospora activa DSM 45169 TaxID=1121389 RepID=A0A2T4ZAU6_9BACL|nr:hypothetical protein [Desmospora activa]PTM58987.1 hypothetical protein C8J48_1586 [Desmospora activa DSM 45169]